MPSHGSSALTGLRPLTGRSRCFQTCADFVRTHPLKWIRPSPDVESVPVPEDILAIRCLLPHDAIQVQPGFDASRGGEQGVRNLVEAQHHGRVVVRTESRRGEREPGFFKRSA